MPILKFQKVEEIKTSPLRLEAFESYVRIARQIKAYEQAKHETFLKESTPIFENMIKMPVLIVLPKSKGIIIIFILCYFQIFLYIGLPMSVAAILTRKIGSSYEGHTVVKTCAIYHVVVI